MSGAPSRVLTDDVTLWVDPEGPCGGGAREIDGGKGALMKQEAMIDAPSRVLANDVTPGVDPEGLGR